MANTNALAILAGINPKNRDHASAPTNLHVLSGEVYSKSEEGIARILLDGLVFSEEDAQWIEVDSLGGLEEGDIATILLAGEEGKGMTPLALGTVGGIDRIVVRVDAIEADYVKATVLDAQIARIDELEADKADIIELVAQKATITDLNTATARIDSLETDNANVKGRLTAAEADIDTLEANSLTADSAVIRNLEADTAKVHNLTAAQLSAATGYIADLTAGNVTAQNIIADKAKLAQLDVDEISADHATIESLDTTYATIANLNSAEARIDSLEADHVTVADFQAEQGYIDQLQANTADIATIRANAAKVQNLTAAQLEADHATIGSLDTTYMHADMSNSDVAWISNGVIANGAISSAMINDVSANKLTAGTINGSVINVTNLNADNITAGTINGQRIGEGSLSLSKLEDDVYTEDEVDAKFSTMQAEIDGAIETWTGTAVPTLQNAPASGWTTTEDRDRHVGDVYFVVNSQSQQNGYNYRFTKSGSTYSWQLIKDTDITNALQRLTTAEGKITTFDSDISTLKTDTGTLTTKTQSLETSLGDKADITTVNEISDTVDGHTQSITQLSTTTTTALQRGVEYINGTQTASTGSWTGVTTDSALYTGKTIAYRLPYAGNGNASLQLKNSSGGNVGGNIAVYMNNTRVTTHYPANTVIKMTYDGTYWRTDNYDSNNYDRERYSASVTASAAIASGRIGVFGTDGNLKLLAASAFDMTRPILYIGTEYKADALTQTNNYVYYGAPFALTNTHAITGAAAGKAVYIVGTISNNVMTPTSTVLTCTEPSTADGYFYLRLGMMATSANAILESNHPLYAYIDGKFQQATPQVVTTVNKVSEHTQTIDGIQTTIGSLQTTVATKADNSTVTTISNKLNQTADTVDGHTSQLTSVTAVANGVRSDLDNLSIGGRNLLKGRTNDMTGTKNGLNYDYDAVTHELRIYGTNTKTDANWSLCTYNDSLLTEALVPGETYTLSVYGDPLTDPLYYQLNAFNTSEVQVSLGAIGGRYQRSAYSFVCPDTYASHNLYALMFVGVMTTVGTVDVTVRLKLEKGTRATDWSPAPEDLASQSDFVSLQTDYATFKQTTTEFESTIGTVIDEKIADISVGGRNLLKLSDTLASSCWSLNSTTVTDGVATVTKVASGDSRVYQMPANGYWAWESNTDYVVSVEARASAAGGKITMNPVGARCGGMEFDITTGWKRYEYAFTSTASPTTGSMSFFNSGETDSVVQFRLPKLERGTKATEWSPAPEDMATASRVAAAETQITQNESAILLRATKTEAYQSAQPNLSPFYSRTPYNATAGDGGEYWNSIISTYRTNMGDGWMRVQYANTGSSVYYQQQRPKTIESIGPSETYTLLAEFRNVNNTGNVYLRCPDGGQAGSSSTIISGEGTRTGIDLLVADGAFHTVAKTNPSTATNYSAYFGICLKFDAGATADFECRVSIYRGEYTGPYKPYSGTQLYASQAELKVQADSIDLKVSKNDVINQINVSTEGATIAANRVNIEGAAIFSSGRLSQTSLNNAYDAKGSAATVQTNLDNLEIGGRNLVYSSGDYTGWLKDSVTTFSGDELDINVSGQTANKFYGAKQWLTRTSSDLDGSSIVVSFEVYSDAWESVTSDMNAGFASTIVQISSVTNPYGSSDSGTIGLYRYMSLSGSIHWTKLPTQENGKWLKFESIPIDISTGLINTDLGTELKPYLMVRTMLRRNGHVKFRRIKVETGTKASAWSPAPEDQMAYVDSIQIGGTNLLAWSDRKGATSTSSSGLSWTHDINGWITVTGTINSSSAGILLFWGTATVSNYIYPAGTYTLTVENDGLLAANVLRVQIHYDGSSIKYLDDSDSITFTAESGISRVCLYRYGANGTAVNGRIRFKMEKGNKVTDWSPAPEDVDASVETASGNGFYVKWDENQSNTYAGGEARFYAYDPVTKTKGTGAGWVLWNGVKRTVPSTTFNPNSAYPFNIPIYLVLRLSSATSTTGTIYAVWYNGGWKYANPDASASSTISDWTWVEATDIVLASCVEPAAEAQFTDCQTYDPPLLCTQVTTITTTAASAQALATTANTTANNAAPKANAVKRTQRIWYRSNSATKPSTPGTASSNWVTKEDDGNLAWTKMHVAISSTHKYIYTCEQYELASGTVGYTTVLLDNTITVIDGATIITGTVHANVIDASSGTFDTANIPNLSADKITSGTIDAARIDASQLTIGGSSLATTQNVTDAVNDISVGGRNFLRDTLYMTGWGKINNTAIVDGVVTFPTVTANTWREIYPSTNFKYDLIRNKQVTFSCEVNVPSGQSSILNLCIGLDTTENAYGRQKYRNQQVNISGTGTWQKVSATADITDAWFNGGSGTVDYNNCWVTVRPGAWSSSWDSFQARLFKLELGNKATDWSPAPEDLDADILSSGIEYIVGTQTAATNLWTGVTKETALVAGKTIAYKLPYAGTSTAATLNLTLAGGGTTGAKTVYRNNSTIGTQFAANSVIQMTYDGSYWRVTGMGSDTVNLLRFDRALKAATAITASCIICGTSSGYKNIAAGISFDLNYPLLYAGSAISANSTGSNNYLAAQLTFSNNGTITSGAANAALYLKGTVDGKTFTISASPFLTTVVPTSDDGLAYIPLGVMSSATAGYFKSSADVYAFRNGAFQKLDTVAKYITAITDAGIRVHAKDNPTTNYAAIDADGMDVVKGGVSVAQFGETARVGKTTGSYVEIDYHSLKLKDREGGTYFHVSDLRDANGVAEMTDKFRGDGKTKTFSLALPSVNTTFSVTVSDGSGGTCTKSAAAITFSTPPSWGSTITAVYTTASNNAKAYTFGARSSGTVGAVSLAEGLTNTASGGFSHAEGYGSTASGRASHSEGSSTASGMKSHAEGLSALASGSYSHAEGASTASGEESHSEGSGSEASGFASHAEGNNTIASGDWSHAQGISTEATGESQTAIGRYNKNFSGATALEVGNGIWSEEDDIYRLSNAMSLEWDGKLNLIDQDMPTSAPSSSYWATGNGLYLYDGDGDETDADDAVGYVRPTWRSDNGRGIQIEAQRTVSGTRTANGIALTVNDSGDPYVTLNRSAWLRALGICSGSVAALGNTAASAYKDKSVSFGMTYSSAPNVIVGFKSDSTAGTFGRCSVSAHSITTTGFTLRFFNGDSSNRNPEFYWIAIGVPVNH